MSSPEPWQEIFMGQVEAQIATRSQPKPPYRDFKARIPLDAAGALGEAAKKRGMSIGAYTRRAALAFVAFDLAIPLEELLENEPGTRLYLADPKVTHLMGGQGHGNWHIRGLT